ncbi:MAG: TolC family protein [Candidatus Aminicenantes bacterium]|nr:TolC family protein [Candidatus Aminicenantes bacterium]
MRKITCSFLIVGVFFSTFPLFSQEVPRGKTALSELIEEALSQNPQIKAARKEWEASLQVIPQAKSLPDPMLNYSYFGQSVETRLGPQKNKFSLSQKFPFFGKLSIRGKIARKGASVLEEQYMAVKLNIVLKVKNTFFSLFWLDRAIRIAQEEKEVLERLTKIAEKKYETGEANQQDVLKAQLEISKVLDKILILNQRKRAITAELNALLNRCPDSFVGEVEEFEVPELRFELEKLYEWAREMRPELRKAQHFIEKNEESLKLAKKNYFPDFRLMFDYIDIGGGTTTNIKDGRNSWMASVGINIPIWRKRLHAAEAEAATKLKASQDSYKNVQNETLSRVNELFFEVETVSEQVNLYKYSLLPLAEQSLKASEVGYLTGKVDFLNLLDAERMVLLIRIGYFKTIADLGKSLAQLERVIGKDLTEM